MRRRRGRPRKGGARHRDGHLKRQAESPRAIAAGMPHRRGLGEKAVDQRAETELGRLTLRGALTEAQGLAGETYLALWRGYVFSLAGPRQLAHGDGHGFTCGGCEEAAARKWCRCAFRRRIFEEARMHLLLDEHDDGISGYRVWRAVEDTVLQDRAQPDVELLRLGLSALAEHFGLQPRKSVISRNAASETARVPAP